VGPLVTSGAATGKQVPGPPSTRPLGWQSPQPKPSRKPSTRSRPLSDISSLTPFAHRLASARRFTISRPPFGRPRSARIGVAQRLATGPRPFIPPGPPSHPRASPAGYGARSLPPVAHCALFAGSLRSPAHHSETLPPVESPASPLARPPRALVRVRCSPAHSVRRLARPRLSLPAGSLRSPAGQAETLPAVESRAARVSRRSPSLGTLDGTRREESCVGCAVRKLHRSSQFPTPGGLKGRTLRAAEGGTL